MPEKNANQSAIDDGNIVVFIKTAKQSAENEGNDQRVYINNSKTCWPAEIKKERERAIKMANLL